MEVGFLTLPQQFAEKVIFLRLLKNAQMQGARDPEEWGVLGCTPQRRRMRATPQMGVFQQPAKGQELVATEGVKEGWEIKGIDKSRWMD
jgi:hypothetical protein